jgi:hypothetical protein
LHGQAATALTLVYHGLALVAAMIALDCFFAFTHDWVRD